MYKEIRIKRNKEKSHPVNKRKSHFIFYVRDISHTVHRHINHTVRVASYLLFLDFPATCRSYRRDLCPLDNFTSCLTTVEFTDPISLLASKMNLLIIPTIRMMMK